MTALEYIMPHKDLYKWDYDDYCWIEKEYLSLLKNDDHPNDFLYYSRCELLEIFTEDTFEAYLMDKETRARLDSIELCFDKNTMDWESVMRKPYYRMRGKKVTEEQAAEIISCIYDPDNNDEDDESKIHLIHMDHIVCKDGTSGFNGITYKYPNINEILHDVLQLKFHFPYLDFIMAISNWNEIPPPIWDDLNKKFREIDFHEGYYHNGKLYEYDNFCDNLDIGIWVHDNKIEIMNSDKTKKKYEEYDRLYSDSDLRKYMNRFIRPLKLMI